MRSSSRALAAVRHSGLEANLLWQSSVNRDRDLTAGQLLRDHLDSPHPLPPKLLLAELELRKVRLHLAQSTSTLLLLAR